MAQDRLEQIVSLAKRRGFVYPSSEIYGGLRASWDYGPLGVELKNNIKRQWWKSMVQGRDDVVGLDSCVILAREVWQASGHVETFSDPLTECTSCHKRYRADHLEEAYENKHKKKPASMDEVNCPNCGTKGKFTAPKQFSGLLKTYLGPVEDESGLAYLRPETAQGIFINFDNVASTSRKKPPFGIGQIGKSFRNEITPGNFIFRTREFEYSKRTADIEYKFEFAGTEWGELEGIANRTDFDLKAHSRASGENLTWFDQEKNERWTPYVIEPAAGVDRCALTFMMDAYTEDEAPNSKGEMEKRALMKLDYRLAPVKIGVLPLSRNADLSPKAKDLADSLRKHWNVDFDDAGAPFICQFPMADLRTINLFYQLQLF